MSRAELLAADRRYMTALIRRARGRCEAFDCGASLVQGACPRCSPAAFVPVPEPVRKLRRARVGLR